MLLLCSKGETWQALIKGHELNPVAQQQDQQRLLLERFQREVRQKLVWAGLCPVFHTWSFKTGVHHNVATL